ncbi:hypothetical protein A2765_01765 [Candidatus Kaiserbacteria bacterium RIFCSPHIGHO2_01_FULL_56_24]|uniref:TIGR03745 family integrating conjugative element membrane protein n=1 Tax=Candidatus Kaiserbacteria bacterium RIFCSPHIGHO2_01_FULL_56_24 TaxID=1798487 RepID=A0A1F6DHC8_9BACT|nr:MAG: hypothetical protein A2765_01765 [Candidatus Kaiserbacteria bacterium RIFCSPHIGHO2_01_FULL_56_24]
MSMRFLIRRFAPIIALLAPMAAAAQESGSATGSLILGLYGVVGFFGAASVVVFIGGLIVYLIRLGTERREEGIKIMEWGFSILVVVVLCIGLLRWLQG